MVSVAARKISSTGSHLNNGLASAMFLAKHVSTQKNKNSATTRKAPKNRSAAGDAKNSENSLRTIRALRSTLMLHAYASFVNIRKHRFQITRGGLQTIQPQAGDMDRLGNFGSGIN